MSHQITRAFRIAFLAMMSALVFEIAKHTVSFHISIWGLPIHAILFPVSVFVVSLVMLLRGEESRSVLELRLQEIGNLRLLIEQSRDGMVIIDSNYRVVETNQMHATMLGYTPEEMRQLCVWDWEAQFTQEQFCATFPQVKTEGASFETKHRRKDGSVYDAEVSVCIADIGGKTLSFCVTRDISVRKAVELALRESEERFRKLLELAPLPLAFATAEGVITFRNQRFVSVFGYTAEDVPTISEWWQCAYPDPEYRQWAITTWKTNVRIAIAEGRDIQPTEANITCKNGEVRTLEVSGITLGDRVLATFIDITERKRAERSLRQSEQRFRNVVEVAPVGMFINTDGLFSYLNPAALALFGAERDEQIVGQTVLERIHPDSRTAVSERTRQVTEERQSAPFTEERYLRLDGTELDVEVTAIPFIFEERDGALVFIRDITSRKREEEKRRELEQQLRQAQKMEAVGRLAGGIAHDFNNLLMVIQSYTEMLQDSLPIHDGLRKNTEQVLKAANRAASLTGQMLAFSRKQITSPVVLDLNAVIDETTKMLMRLIGEHIEFRVDSAESLWTVLADSDQIVQVLMNLCVNSRDAMPQGGMLTVATENITVTEGSTGRHPYVAPGEYVKLAITDTGMGIPKEEQEKIFEPFYTTKEVGKGTGLGLAMIYGIVKQNRGYVWVDSELGQGSCFTICLPRAKGVLASDRPVKTDAQPRGTETLLVAEDEEALREAICAYLCTLGYTVLAASSGQQALSTASEYEGRIDLLISDVVMPKMSGRELSQMMGNLRPDLKTIHMSGYTDDAVLRNGIQDMDAAFLQKPFSLATLARKVRDTLGN
jgi:PAS domain S-box-containing protein